MKILLTLLFATAAFAAEAQTATLNLAWDHAGPLAREFKVYQETAPGVWTLVKTVTEPTPGAGAPKTTTLTSVTPGVYTYRVTAANIWGESAPSNTTTTPAPVNPPTNVRVTIVPN